jgi:hypothetical protein
MYLKNKIILYCGLGMLLSLLYINSINAQSNKLVEKPKKTFSERLTFGGALGLSFGSYSSLVDISPIVGYALSDDLIVGIGLTYKFYRYKDYYYNIDNGALSDLRTNIYGGSVWMRYFLTKTEIPVIENIFLHGEVEPLTFVNLYRFNPNGNIFDPFGNQYVEENERINLTGVFLGGGLSQPVGGRSYMYIEVLWDFNEELYSPYSNPRIRIGFAAGF